MAVLDRNSGAVAKLSDVERLANQYQVPVEDVLLIAINLFGIWSEEGRHRARIAVRLAMRPTPAWTVIVPLNVTTSPFRIQDDLLMLDGEIVGTVERVIADDAVGGYFRDEGRAATLNPNARSRCVGCAFCPNTLEAAADPRLAEERQLGELLAAMTAQHPRHDLSELREVTVSTGCFERERAAVEHIRSLREALSAQRIGARIGFLTSVLRTDSAFEELATYASPFVLRLTAECFGRRSLLLKSSKAELAPVEMPHLLRRAMRAGHDTSFTYIVGLDSLPELRDGVAQMLPCTTEFPNFQVYQAHNSIMTSLRADGSGSLEFYLQARREIERLFEPTGLRPAAWEGYRSLWYFKFGSEWLVRA